MQGLLGEIMEEASVMSNMPSISNANSTATLPVRILANVVAVSDITRTCFTVSVDGLEDNIRRVDQVETPSIVVFTLDSTARQYGCK